MRSKTPQALTTQLGARGWFAELPASLQQLILGEANLLNVPSGKIIYRQGDPPNGLFGICSGRIKYTYTHLSGKEIVSGFGSAGGWFGEVSMIDALPRHHTTSAVSEASLLQVSPRQFDALIAAQPGLMKNFASLLCGNMRRQMFFNGEVMMQPPRIRLRRLLSHLAQGDVRQGREKDIVLEINQEQMASMIDLSRQTVNESLRLLQKQGLIEIQYGAIIILDAARLDS
ncbi:MAG: Crp/Fnr family transcriptional regulator [Hyphomonadaceae bacterium]|nr:Crp/Fnr family transcriptional regulator [Hyphomonadaceae bacterium]